MYILKYFSHESDWKLASNIQTALMENFVTVLFIYSFSQIFFPRCRYTCKCIMMLFEVV